MVPLNKGQTLLWQQQQQEELKTSTATPILVRRQQCNLAIHVAAKISLEVAATVAVAACDDVAGTRRMRNQRQNGDRIVTVCNYFCLGAD